MPCIPCVSERCVMWCAEWYLNVDRVTFWTLQIVLNRILLQSNILFLFLIRRFSVIPEKCWISKPWYFNDTIFYELLLCWNVHLLRYAHSYPEISTTQNISRYTDIYKIVFIPKAIKKCWLSNILPLGYQHKLAFTILIHGLYVHVILLGRVYNNRNNIVKQCWTKEIANLKMSMV